MAANFAGLNPVALVTSSSTRKKNGVNTAYHVILERFPFRILMISPKKAKGQWYLLSHAHYVTTAQFFFSQIPINI